MTKDEVLNRVLKSATVSTLPSIASKLISITSNEETSSSDIANLILKDASLSTKILKIANSAFYSFPYKISTVHQAISSIGINSIRSLVLSFSFLSMKNNNKKDLFDYEKFWEQSLSTAVAAKLIMARIGTKNPEEIFIAGLLQDIGELILARSFPEQYHQVLSCVSNGEQDIIKLEQEIIGADHTFIGYEITTNWNFPNGLKIPILYHHCPETYKGNDKKLKTAINVIYLSLLIKNIMYSNKPREYHQKFLNDSKKMLGFSDDVTSKILDNVSSEINQTASFFELNIKNQKSIEEILHEANVALSIINLSYEQMNKELIATKIQLQKISADLAEKNKRLEKLAHIDGLTQVYNHRYFQSYLEKEISRSARRKETLCLILADVDHFKYFNDSYGHQVGDFILKELCTLMSKALRDYDLLARYGGEEFAIILVATTQQKALVVAEKLRETIAMHSFIHNDKAYTVTVSFGIAEIKAAVDTFSKNELISFADKALFESKKNGRNRVTIYTPKKSWFG
ncbi:MAG: GGDEF domain-containing protein [Candidatus Brocadiaceae bacterium]|nr:GGDEF domain-containing protein [Candidatus Brocadiaceae bacterium]